MTLFEHGVQCGRKALIKNLHLLKGYGSRKLLAEFPEKNWAKSGLDTLLRKLRDTGSYKAATIDYFSSRLVVDYYVD